MTERKSRSKAARQKPTWRSTRRDFLGGATAVGVGIAAGLPVVLTPGKARASEVIRYADDGGRTGQGRDKLYIKPFMKATGIEVKTYIGQKNLAKMKAMVKANNLEFDMVNDGGSNLVSASKAGLLEKLDKSKLDLTHKLFPEWDWEDTLAWEYFSGGLGYNEETISDPPTTWADFWDIDKYPGRRGMRTRPQYTLEEALMADGVAPKDVYPMDLERAFKSMDRIKPHIKIWIEQTAKTIEHLQTQELDYTSTFSGRIFIARSEGLPLNFVFDMPNSSPQNVGIMKGAQNYDSCLKLVQWFFNGEPGVEWFTAFIGYGPTDSETMAMLSDEVKSKLPDPANPKANWVDVGWWGDNLEDVVKQYKTWLLT